MKARWLSLPQPSVTRTSSILASVKVPVLSVHSTSMAPRSWIADRRFTTTLRFDRRIADRASVTVTIMGSSSGVSPTASASANISDSSTGRCSETFTTTTNSTISTVRRMIRMPKRRMPVMNAVAGAFSERLLARRPSEVLRPVRQTRMVAVPLITDVPANSAFGAFAGSSAATPRSSACLGTG